MCTYLNKTGSSYYFRRPVPDDLRGHFVTDRGNPRTEWKRALGTKDREEAKRRLHHHSIETDKLIDDARRELQLKPRLSPEELAAQEREFEKQAALAAVEARKRERQADPARKQARLLLRQRMALTTAELTPQERAIHDLIREGREEGREEGLAFLEEQVVKVAAGRPTPLLNPAATPRINSSPTLTLTGMFEDYAQSGAATPHTVKKWRAAIQAFIAHLGHDDASAVSRSDVSGWLKALVASGLSTRTVRGTYRAAVARIFKLAHGDGLLATNVAAALEVRGPKAIRTARDDISDGEV